MVNTVVSRDKKSSSTNPLPTKNNRDRREASRNFQSQKSIKSGGVSVKNTSTQNVGTNGTNSNNINAARTGSGMQLSPMLQTIIKNNKVVNNPTEVNKLSRKLLSQSNRNSPNASKSELEQIRVIMGAGLTTQAQPFGQLSQQQQMKAALKNDINLREQRISQRDNKISGLESNLNQAESKLNSYNQYISNGNFTGTEAQYRAYQNAYNQYETAYNQYSSTVQLQNTDIATYNKNVQSIDAKKSFKSARKTASKISAAYNAANDNVSNKIPTVKQAEPYIRKFVESSGVGYAAGVTDKILKRKDTEKLVQFYLGGYQSVQQKPLKAAATFATFFVGGIAVKGLSTAAKTLGAGAKTAKAARFIESGLLNVYVVSSGVKLVESKDARELGYHTGDIIFNELLPAGLGVKLGVKVVESIPKGAVELRVAGIKAKTVAKRASKPIKTTAKRTQQAIVKDIRALRKEQFIRKYQKLNEREMSALVRSYLKEGKEPPGWLRKEWSKILSSKSKKQSLSSFSKFLANEKAQLKPRTGLKEKIKTGTMTQAEFNKLLSSRPTRSKKFSGIDNLESQIYRTSNLSKVGVKNKRTLTRCIAKEIVKNPNRNPRTIIGALSLTNRNTYNSLSMYQKVGLVKAFARFITPSKGTGTVRQLKATVSPAPSAKPATQAASKAKTTTNTSPRPRQKASQKAAEKPPELIVTKLASVSGTKKKRRTTKKKSATSKQRNVNVVATFRDLIG